MHAFIISENFSQGKFFSTVAVRIFHMSGFMTAMTNILSEPYYYWSPRSFTYSFDSKAQKSKYYSFFMKKLYDMTSNNPVNIKLQNNENYLTLP